MTNLPPSLLRLPRLIPLPRPHCPRRCLRHPTTTSTHLRTYAARAPQTDKSRILERPTRFNPPSHGSRRLRPSRNFPGPRLSDAELDAQKVRRYPNMMPAEGTLMYSILTTRWLHVVITMGVLTFLAAYSMSTSFLHTTIYRDQLPLWSDLYSHPFQALRQFFSVYKLHVAHESEVVAEKRRRKIADAAKRKEFLREHGVEPGFLTGGWMDKFGTVEGDRWKAEREGKLLKQDEEARAQEDVQSPVSDPAVQATVAMAAGTAGADVPGEGDVQVLADGVPQERREKKKPKAIFGIW